VAVGVSLLGHGFMGRAHAHALSVASHFYDVEKPALACVYGRDLSSLVPFARRFGFSDKTSDLHRAISLADAVVIALPNSLHSGPSIEALGEGKHVLVEKPMAATLGEAVAMVDAARGAAKRRVAAVGFNYRFVPAVLRAKALVPGLGRVYEFRASYLHQSLSNPQAPLGWRGMRELAGLGVLGDLGSHVFDMARFLVGDVEAVVGLTGRAAKERPGPSGMVPVEVDEAFASLLRFKNGAYGTVEASKLALGRANSLRFEVYGERGSLSFDLERMNELEVVSEDGSSERLLLTDPWSAVSEGATDVSLPSGKTWPPGHPAGWEDAVVGQDAQFLRAASGQGELFPAASFDDGLAVQAIAEAVLRSESSGRWEEVGTPRGNPISSPQLRTPDAQRTGQLICRMALNLCPAMQNLYK